MEKLTRTDLMKLSSVCKASYYEARAVMASADASGLEKELAKLHAEYMADLMATFDRIMDTGAKRVEIRL